MRTVPRNQFPKISFFQSRLPKWAENASDIGLNPDDVVTMQEKTDAARAALSAQRLAQQAAEGATLNLRMALDAMATQGASMLMQIRAKAAMSGDAVYPLASISPPSKGSPIGEPGQPNRFNFTMDQEGTLRLTWMCKNPRGSVGTMYQVYREVDGGKREFLGTTGTKRFTDKTVPAGTRKIVYQVRAVRSTSVGELADFNVNFGGSALLRAQMQRMKNAA